MINVPSGLTLRRAVMDIRAQGCQKQTMLPFKLVCGRDFYLPLGNNLFPWQKYRLMCNQLLETGIAGAGDFVEPKSAPDEDILLVHTRDYVTKLRTGTPVMVTLGGGYAFNVLDTVTIHCNTVVAAKHVFSSVG